ncbi:hypothetical protein [Gimesia maris]|nr:hypothetical protein [Gimesia maris]QGQ31596.1 hypothetical protein F1729_24805 [Gimesia maris]|tara:strand:+ start:36067 stop:36465 length:399 start_codon:yes stop_codon:yes gene_type:complete
MMRHYETADSIREMIAYFLPFCDDKITLQILLRMSECLEPWDEADALYERIRQKTVIARKQNASRALAQYAFEESCAKTLYNMSKPASPYYSDAPFWVIPLGFRLACALELPDPCAFSSLLDDDSDQRFRFM